MSGDRANREGVQDQLRTIIRRAHQVAEGLDAETFTRRPEPGTWSIAECLDHLNESVRLYLPELTDTIETAREEGHLAPPGSPERTLFGRFVAWTQEPPVRFRMKTFEVIEPTSNLDAEAVLPEFEALHEELIVRINEAADLDRKKVRMRSVLDRRLKLSLGDWFHFLAAHARRHLWQARQVRDRLEEESSGS